MLVDAELPDDPALLRAMLVATEARITERDQRIADLEGAGTDAQAEIERLNAIIAASSGIASAHDPSSSIPTSWRLRSRSSTPP